MDKFSDILKDLIQDKSKSLRQIAKESGISSSQLSKYLKGTIPNVEISIKLANYFECGLDYLYGFVDTKSHKQYCDFELDYFLENYLRMLKTNNLSHWKLCGKIGLSESCIRHWKNGETPKMSTIILIAEALGVSLDNFIKTHKN